MIGPARESELFDLVQSAARARGVADIEMMWSAAEESLTRFANNVIHQNVAERGVQLSVRPQEGRRTARAHTRRQRPVAMSSQHCGSSTLEARRREGTLNGRRQGQ